MGLGISAIQNILELHNLGYFNKSDSILDIGSQEIHIYKNDLKELYSYAGFDPSIIEQYPDIDNYPKKPRCSAKYFYKTLGFKNYNCIDINDEFESINHDLNKPFTDTSMYNKFDVVTDFGSCEHVFNIAECYKTVHNLTKPGGFIVIAQGTLKGNGYFLFDKPFFDGMAAANNYKVIYNSYIISTGTKTLEGSLHQFHIPQSYSLYEKLNFALIENASIYVVFQKQEDASFKIPYEHEFMNEYYNISGFNRMYFKDPLSYSYLKSSKVTTDEISFKALLKIFFKRLFSRFK